MQAVKSLEPLDPLDPIQVWRWLHFPAHSFCNHPQQVAILPLVNALAG